MVRTETSPHPATSFFSWRADLNGFCST
jgi:hypothetical protein